jgi:hypothetical protein
MRRLRILRRMGLMFCVVRMVLDLILLIFLVRLRIILLKGLIQTQKLGH